MTVSGRGRLVPWHLFRRDVPPLGNNTPSLSSPRGDEHCDEAPRLEKTDLFRAGDRYHWLVVGNGCGHALQITQGQHRGRIVLPVWLSVGTGGHAHRSSDLTVVYSDDRGSTWHRGDFIAHNGDTAASGERIVNPSETALVELSDGRVLANIRSESPRHRRLLSESADGATGWSKPAFHDALLEPICMGSMARLADDGLLFANPDNLLVRGKPGRPCSHPTRT